MLTTCSKSDPKRRPVAGRRIEWHVSSSIRHFILCIRRARRTDFRWCTVLIYTLTLLPFSDATGISGG